MIDRETIINGCEKWVKNHKGEQLLLEYSAVENLLAVLKEQEAVKPYVTGRGESFETAETWWYACGNCHEALDPDDKYCRHCGRAVAWSD